MIKTKFTIQKIEDKGKKKSNIPYRVDANRKKLLKIAAAERGTSIQALIDEALDMLLKKSVTVIRATKHGDES